MKTHDEPVVSSNSLSSHPSPMQRDYRKRIITQRHMRSRRYNIAGKNQLPDSESQSQQSARAYVHQTTEENPGTVPVLVDQLQLPGFGKPARYSRKKNLFVKTRLTIIFPLQSAQPIRCIRQSGYNFFSFIPTVLPPQ